MPAIKLLKNRSTSHVDYIFDREPNGQGRKLEDESVTSTCAVYLKYSAMKREESV